MKRSVDPKPSDGALTGDAPLNESGFFRRWSRRKAQSETVESEVANQETDGDVFPRTHEALPTVGEPPSATLTDADMPAIESLDENSDYSPFFSPGVSETLRQSALRKLFRSASFNELCPLEGEYHDCRGYEELGSIVTHEMRAQLKREAAELAKRTQSALKEVLETSPSTLSSLEKRTPESDDVAAPSTKGKRSGSARRLTRSSSGSGKRRRREKC